MRSKKASTVLAQMPSALALLSEALSVASRDLTEGLDSGDIITLKNIARYGHLIESQADGLIEDIEK